MHKRVSFIVSIDLPPGITLSQMQIRIKDQVSRGWQPDSAKQEIVLIDKNTVRVALHKVITSYTKAENA